MGSETQEMPYVRADCKKPPQVAQTAVGDESDSQEAGIGMESRCFRRRWPLTEHATSLSAFGVVEGKCNLGMNIWRLAQSAMASDVESASGLNPPNWVRALGLTQRLARAR